MANVKNNLAAQDTRRRLLQAAGEVFAEKGLPSSTIKEITERAGANIAAINYHFRDKNELYAEVIRRIEIEAAVLIPSPDSLSGDARARFRQFVRHVTLAMLGRDQPAWERVILARELSWPSPAMRSLLNNVAGPLHRMLAEIVAELMGCSPTSEKVAHVSASTLGQCVYYLQHRSQLQNLFPQFKSDPTAETIANHIADFSLAGVMALAENKSSRKPVRRVRRG